MTKTNVVIIGKTVKDMYGTFIGKVVGTITDIDSTIQTVGIDCGSQGLQHVPFEQLVAQGEIVVFIPKWRLESQRLLREKGLTLRRLKALMEIVSDNDEMKDDAAMINDKYKSQLLTFEDVEKEIDSSLTIRLGELDEQTRSVKMLVFDAKIQFKSNEISDSTFESVKTQTSDLIERITHEKAEISNLQRRVMDLNMEVKQTMDTSATYLQDSAVSYLSEQPDMESKLPEAPIHTPVSNSSEDMSVPPQITAQTMESKFPEAPIHTPVSNNSEDMSVPPQITAQTIESEPESSEQSDWLARMTK